MNQDKNELININGKNLFVNYRHIFENRPTLVFLHDSLGCAQLWRDFPNQLSAATQCNILAYDRLGYGNSESMPTYERPTHYMEQEADILKALLEEFKIKDAILFGHSDGGTIALIAASKYPQNIQSIIVEAAHIFVEEVTLQGICNAIEAYQTTNLPERLAKYHGDKVDMIFKAWTQTWTHPDYREWNIEYLLSGITCPVLFIQGDADEYGTLHQVEKTISQVSGKAEKFIIPAIGHTPHKEVPDKVLAATTTFIQAMENS